MVGVDLNLLVALDVLLSERSVTRAARRLGLSPSAASRTLARLRAATGDPLLVQAGRGLAPTPYAEALGERVHAVAADARAILTPASGGLDLPSLERTFVIRANEGFISLFAPALLARVRKAAPRARLRFAPKAAKEALLLREGSVDIEVGTDGPTAPELRRQLLFRDHFVGVVRRGHALLDQPVTPARYAAWGHVIASRRGVAGGPVDAALQTLGLTREIVAIVPGFLDALELARRSDLVALVPNACVLDEDRSAGLEPFELPVSTPGLAIDLIWHPRMDRDPAHRWLRGQMLATCRPRTHGARRREDACPG